MSIDEVIPYASNPRNNDGEAVERVAASIKEFGFKNPIIIDKEKVVVCGHTRLKAAKKLGIKEIPTIKADDLTPAQIKAFRIADNRVSEYATWDNELLTIELEGLKELEYDLDLTGFDTEEVNDLLSGGEVAEIQEDDYEIELPPEPKAKIGDVYQLGEHRLVCGDCTNTEHLDLLMNGEMADMVLTDPPYNMNYSGAGNTKGINREKNKILNDNLPDEDFEKFLVDVNGSIFSYLKDGSSFYIFYKELGTGVFITSLKSAGLTFKQMLIWVKNSIVLGGSKYQSMYEPCVFGCKGKSIKCWYADRKERSVIEYIDLMNEDELRETIKELLQRDETDIIRANKNLKNDLHPTMKPIRLLAKLINNSSKANDIVLDLFGGSGSTLVACEQTNRKCRLMELDPKYVDVIIDRWETLTGEKAVLINGEL